MQAPCHNARTSSRRSTFSFGHCSNIYPSYGERTLCITVQKQRLHLRLISLINQLFACCFFWIVTVLSVCCRIADADWVITPPGKFAKDIDLYRAITWRRVIVDEVHLLNARLPGEHKGWLAREVALMEALNSIPVTVARWCLSGTPLKNLRQIQAMDRIFTLLQTGFYTSQCHNLTFVAVLEAIAIRFTNKGQFNVSLLQLGCPPVCNTL
jgi:SNF2 family DNA or RNA helicase